MFGIDLYPTPREVIEKMLFGIEVTNKVVLEPSAGTGNIVDYLNDHGAKDVLACEIDERLRKILSQKCHIIETDFLNVTKDQVSHVDLIVMNPPFMADEKHILHAWDIAPAGCQVIALCNESRISNQYSRTRRELGELVKYHGRSEKFGDCFSDAERKTGVEVSCLWLFKPGEKENEFDGYFDLHDYEQDEMNDSGIVRYDFIRDVVGRYVEAISIFEEVEATNKRISDLIKGVTERFSISFGASYNTSSNNRGGDIDRLTFKKELQKSAWKSIFDKMNMDKYVTRGVMANINKFVEQQIQVPFTVRNVYQMIHLIAGTHSQRMDQVLVEAFEKICSYSADNSSAGEKWRTNSDYMVNRKFIKPLVCEWDSRWPSNTIKIRYTSNESMDDIVKALCHLTGKSYEDYISLSTYFNYPYKLRRQDGSIIPGSNNCFNTLDGYSGANQRKKDLSNAGNEVEIINTGNEWGSWHEWGFFRVKGFKKGTMHFEFLDEDVWMKFNRRVAEIKGWNLPRNTRKAYSKKEGVEIY